MLFSFPMESILYSLCDNSESTQIRDVLNGNFPKHVKRMNTCRLERFVLSLAKYASLEAGGPISTVSDYKENVIFEELRQKKREFRVTLLELILKYCDFFRIKSVKQKWPPNCDSWINVENVNAARTRIIKRKKSDAPLLVGAKKRRTLLSKNESDPERKKLTTRPSEPVVCLYDILETATKDVRPTQQQFLKILGLGCNNYIGPTPDKSQYSKYIKLHSCPHIPFSSDVGKAIIKRENCSVPDYVTSRKLERVEWYVNKEPSQKVIEKCQVSFATTKFCDYHYYRFPKRQLHQIRGNTSYTNFLLKMCKPLDVVVENEDLIYKKKCLDNLKITVNVNRLSLSQLQKHICKNFDILLTDISDRKLRLRRYAKLKAN